MGCGLSKWVISRVISALNGVTLIITLLITNLLSPLPLEVNLNPEPRTPRFPTEPQMVVKAKALPAFCLAVL